MTISFPVVVQHNVVSTNADSRFLATPLLLQISVVWFSLMLVFKKIQKYSALPIFTKILRLLISSIMSLLIRVIFWQIYSGPDVHCTLERLDTTKKVPTKKVVWIIGDVWRFWTIRSPLFPKPVSWFGFFFRFLQQDSFRNLNRLTKVNNFLG